MQAVAAAAIESIATSGKGVGGGGQIAITEEGPLNQKPKLNLNRNVQLGFLRGA
jgi:hypothetical protein